MTRLSIVEAADALGVSVATVATLARRRAWEADADGRLSRTDIEAERLQRARCVYQARGPKMPTADSFTREGADKLARSIRDYWARRGRAVNVWIEPGEAYTNALRTGTWFVVRSDLVDGRPRK